jgi:uncharacterized protein YgiB involved in biofilm formation
MTRLQGGCAITDAGVSDPCCQPCWGTANEDCDDTLREFPNQARTRREFEEMCGSEERLSVAGGQCSSGVHFLAMANGYVIDTRFFDASGNFIGLLRWTDDATLCNGRRYFPEAIPCAETTGTENLCQ